MRACQFQWSRPTTLGIAEDEGGEAEEQADEAELNLDRVEEEMAAEYSEEEEEDILHINGQCSTFPAGLARSKNGNLYS